MRAVGVREQGPESVAEVTADRQRAYTLFVTSHDQVRRAISYLRWEQGDVDDIAPSLFAGKKRRETEPEHPSTPEQPAPPGGNGTPVNRSLDHLPGGSPFMQ